MPRKRPEKPAYERPTLFPITQYQQLTDPQRQELRAIFQNPVFKLALQNAHLKKPSCALPESIHVLPQVSNNRIHQIQGWEMFEAALFMQTEVIVRRTPPKLEEKFQAD